MNKSKQIQVSSAENAAVELADRMMDFYPNADQIGRNVILAGAHLALQVGANPNPAAGEMYVWLDWQKKPTVMLGVAYYRRKANEVDTPLWAEEPRRMTDQEHNDHGLSNGDIGAICTVYRMSGFLKLLESGLPADVAIKSLGRTGIGRVKHSEMFAAKDTKYRKKGSPIDPPNGRSWLWLAQKRAEIDAYRVAGLVQQSPYDINTVHVHSEIDYMSLPTVEESKPRIAATVEETNAFFGLGDDAIEGDFTEDATPTRQQVESFANEHGGNVTEIAPEDIDPANFDRKTMIEQESEPGPIDIDALLEGQTLNTAGAIAALLVQQTDHYRAVPQVLSALDKDKPKNGGWSQDDKIPTAKVRPMVQFLVGRIPAQQPVMIAEEVSYE